MKHNTVYCLFFKANTDVGKNLLLMILFKTFQLLGIEIIIYFIFIPKIIVLNHFLSSNIVDVKIIPDYKGNVSLKNKVNWFFYPVIPGAEKEKGNLSLMLVYVEHILTGCQKLGSIKNISKL